MMDHRLVKYTSLAVGIEKHVNTNKIWLPHITEGIDQFSLSHLKDTLFNSIYKVEQNPISTLYLRVLYIFVDF